MKLTLQKKLLLPILGTLLALMTCSTMIIISIVNSQLEKAFQQELDATSVTLLRNVGTAATSYKISVRAIASTARLRALADVLGGQGGNREEGLRPSIVAFEASLQGSSIVPVLLGGMTISHSKPSAVFRHELEALPLGVMW